MEGFEKQTANEFEIVSVDLVTKSLTNAVLSNNFEHKINFDWLKLNI